MHDPTRLALFVVLIACLGPQRASGEPQWAPTADTPATRSSGPAATGDDPTPTAAGGGRIAARALPAGGANAVKLDGEFGEEAWALAEPVTGFLQYDPAEGAPPTFETEVRALYDRDCLYVAARAFDSTPAAIVGIRTRRDADSPSDWLRVMIDSYRDQRTAYEFAVNAAGVKQDRYWFADGNNDVSWDAVWDVSVTRDEQGWRAEFRIPFSQLRFVSGRGDRFGFAVQRQIGRLNETSTWPLIAKSKPGFVSQFGELRGLELGRAAKRLELVPYSVAQVVSQPVATGNPFLSSPDPRGTMGLDMKYAVTPGLMLTTTINPDFGQVEADPALVNLTAFERFYQDRRPFFVEGSGNLQFDLDCNEGACTGLFYSRRIGRRPRGEPAVPQNGHVATPPLTTILGAAKLTGRAGAFAVGALNALTGAETARISDADRRWHATVEPLTNYSVAQAKREWTNRSSLGFAFTNTARRIDGDTSALPATATTGGVNWDWRLKPDYALTGYWAGSTLHGSSEAIDSLQQSAVHYYQRPDASYLDYDAARTSLNGQAGAFRIQKIGGPRVRFSVGGSFKTPAFDVNDVGYQRRADEVTQSASVQVRWDRPTKLYRSARLTIDESAGWNFGGDTRYKSGRVSGYALLASNWTVSAATNVSLSGIDDRATRGGPALRSRSGGFLWFYVESDSRKAFGGGTAGWTFRNDQRDMSWGFAPSVSFRPTSFLNFTGSLNVERFNDATQWVENVTEGDSTHYVFGQIRQTTVGITGRCNYTIAPDLTLQLYAQPFVSAGAYSGFKHVVQPRAERFADQFAPYAYSGNPDFNYRSFRMTNVLRWEYRPGSALYVVWQQVREGSASAGRSGFRQEMGDLFGLPATNVFLVKFSYWLNR